MAETYGDKVAEADARHDAKARGEYQTYPHTGETVPLLVLDFGDGKRGEFKAHRYANQFLMVKHIDNMFAGGYDGLVAATTLAMDQVLPEEKEKLEQFLFENGRSDQYIIAIQNGLNGVLSGETNLPLESSQDSSETTSPQDGDQSSTDDSSSPATPEETRPNLEVA